MVFRLTASIYCVALALALCDLILVLQGIAQSGNWLCTSISGTNDRILNISLILKQGLILIEKTKNSAQRKKSKSGRVCLYLKEDKVRSTTSTTIWNNGEES